MNKQLFQPFTFEQAQRLKIINRTIIFKNNCPHTKNDIVLKIVSFDKNGICCVFPITGIVFFKWGNFLNTCVFEDTGAPCGYMLSNIGDLNK